WHPVRATGRTPASRGGWGKRWGRRESRTGWTTGARNSSMTGLPGTGCCRSTCASSPEPGHGSEAAPGGGGLVAVVPSRRLCRRARVLCDVAPEVVGALGDRAERGRRVVDHPQRAVLGVGTATEPVGRARDVGAALLPEAATGVLAGAIEGVEVGIGRRV